MTTRTRALTLTGGATLVVALGGLLGRAQGPGSTRTPQTARVETALIDLAAPERYQVPSILEPVRRVTSGADGRRVSSGSFPQPVGATVKESQDLAELDRAEAKARLKIAEASVREMQAEVEGVSGKGAGAASAIATARLEAAKARAEIAQIDVDRCTLRAPFNGRILSVSVSPGQYVAKGTSLAELAGRLQLPGDGPGRPDGRQDGGDDRPPRRGEDRPGQGPGRPPPARRLRPAPRACEAPGPGPMSRSRTRATPSNRASASAAPTCPTPRSPRSRRVPSTRLRPRPRGAAGRRCRS